MISARSLDRLDQLAWVLIYGGLILLVLALAVHGANAVAAWSMGVAGGAAAVGGVVLVAIRPRLADADGGAQSADTKQRGAP